MMRPQGDIKVRFLPMRAPARAGMRTRRGRGLYAPASIIFLCTAVAGLAAVLVNDGLSLAHAAQPSAKERAQESVQETGRGTVLASIVATQRGDLLRAERFAAQAYDINPESPRRLLNAFSLAATMGRPESLPLARKLLIWDDRLLEPRLLLSIAAIRIGDPQGAQEVLKEADPSEEIGRLLLPFARAWLYLAEEKPQAAAQAVKDLLSDPQLAAISHYHHALLLEQMGDPGQKQAFAATTPRQIPFNGRRAVVIGNYYERQGDFAQAITLYESFLNPGLRSVFITGAERNRAQGTFPAPLLTTPQDGFAELLLDLALFLGQGQKRRQAMTLVRQNLLLAPDSAWGQYFLGDLFAAYGQNEEALAAYAALKEDETFSWLAQIKSGEILSASARTQDALELFTQLAEVDPTSALPHIELGNLFLRQERFSEAAQAYDQALGLLGTPKAADWTLMYRLGIALERAQRWPEAEAVFLRALDLNPKQPEVMNYLAYSWVDQSLYLHRAYEMLKEAAALSPNNGAIIDSLGWALYRMGRFEKSVEALEQAVALDPESAVIHDHLGDAYWQRQRRLEARFQWQRALTLEPEADFAPRLEMKLREGLPAESQEAPQQEAPQQEAQFRLLP